MADTLSPHGRVFVRLSFSPGEKVAEGRGRMRGLVIHKMFAKKTRIYGIAMRSANHAVRGFSVGSTANPPRSIRSGI